MKKKSNSHSILFVYLSIMFVVCLLLSNILAAKILRIGQYSITAGVLVFPISYIINDILSEVYGYKNAKNIIIFGFMMNVFMVLVFSLAIVLPAPNWFSNSDAFATILGSTPRVCAAGIMAYLFGSLVNAKIIVKMKEKNHNKFSVRAIISTIFGELTDSIIFVTLAFIGKMPIHELCTMIILQVIIKTLYEIICLPITTIVVQKTLQYEEK